MTPIRIAGAQGFYGDSPMAAMAIVQAKAADYLVHDALAELTLSILQKDRQRDPAMGYARDIEFLAKTLIPMAFRNGIKVVTNSGGLNPESAAKKVAEILSSMGVKGLKIAAITGDNFHGRIDFLQNQGISLSHMETGEPYPENLDLTHANVYTGARSVSEALAQGADLILAGRVADPCLTLGILVHEYGWDLDSDLDLLAAGITAGHVIECGGQASGGNSYAEWPQDYNLSNLAYPIAHVYPDGTAEFTRLKTQGGKVSRDTIREQLVYEIHDPANYITPDVTVDLTGILLTEVEPDLVRLTGVKGKPRPEQLKLAIGFTDGYLTEQFFFTSWPYAYKKAQRFIEACKEIWSRVPMLKIERSEFDLVGVNGIHGSVAPEYSPEHLQSLNEVGIRLAIRHRDERTGKMALQAITCLGLNGPPGLISMPAWGKVNRALLGLWPTLVPREVVVEKVEILVT